MMERFSKYLIESVFWSLLKRTNVIVLGTLRPIWAKRVFLARFVVRIDWRLSQAYLLENQQAILQGRLAQLFYYALDLYT